MKAILFVLLGFVSMLTISCDKPMPATDVDLTGFEVTPIPGSETFKATKTVDGRKTQEGYILNGKKHGLWTDHHPDGKVQLMQHFVNGILEGPVISMDNRGQITAMTEYSKGELHGLKATYKFGRPQEEIPYVEGKISGVMKKYYTNNKLMEEAEYKNNVQDGFYRHYNEEGTMDLEYVYKNGEKVSGGIVDPDGQQ